MRIYSLVTTALIALLILCSARADRSESGAPRLMEGPMAGAPLEGELRVWARISGPYAFSIRYADNPQMEGARESSVERASEAGDYCVVTRAEGIQPGADYWYVTLIDGERPKYEKDKPPYRTRSAPAGDAAFSVAFGSCARVMEDPRQPIWESVVASRPDLFFWLGDNIYGDSLYPQFLAEEYRKQRSVSGLQPLLRSVPQLATWDDHDYGLNDHDRENPIKEEALALFRAYWANPSYGEPSNPGVYFKYAYGGVDFFFLDGRYYRAPYDHPDDGSKTMLGERQLEWLKSELRNSRSPFKVLVSGSGWTSLKGPRGDSWAAFLAERDALFAWMVQEEIEGVVLLSGDTHRGELNCIPWSEKGGYDLYEFVSSPLSQDTSSKAPVDMWEVVIEEPYTGATNFGLLRFDLEREDPLLTFRLVNQYGMESYDAFALRASDLRIGVSSWRRFASRGEISRHEKWKER